MTLTTMGSQVYIDGLETALEEAVCVLDLAKANLKNAQNKYSSAKIWKQLLTAYWDRVQKTNELAEAILGSIPNLIVHYGKVCDNTDEGNAAVNLIVNAAKLVAQCADSLKSKVQSLQYKIACLNDPNLDQSKGILKCLNDLNTSIDTAQTAACIAIEKSLKVLESSCNLATSLNEENGLKTNLNQMEANIKLGAKPGLEDIDLTTLGRKPKFPLTTRDCDYYDYLKKQAYAGEPMGSAIRECEAALEDLENKQNVKDMAQAKHDAVHAALKAALAAKKC